MKSDYMGQVKEYLARVGRAPARNDEGGRAVRRLKEVLGEIACLPLTAFAALPVTTPARREARTITVTRQEIELPRLPFPFDGLSIAFLSDLHCGPLTPPEFLRTVMDETNGLRPDLVLLGGDYVTSGTAYIRPVAEVMRRLRAPLGLYGVLGNHDYWTAPAAVRAALRSAGITDITNGGHWLAASGSRLRIAGVGDLWQDEQDLETALAGATKDDTVVLLSHNPDFAIGLHDPRVKLMLAGHTHGGQIHVPGIGAVITNSRYGRRLVSGLIPFDSFQLFVSRGIGTVVVPLRFHAPPEIALLTLRRRA